LSTLQNIGKYEIRREIGRGAMGVVFEGYDPAIGRRVAIKTLRLEIFEATQADDVRARFRREAQSAGQLSHPHIVTIHDYGEHLGMPYIVMEYIVGTELSRILGRGTRLPVAESARLMLQLLAALGYAHEHKVVHRDIKPGNIVILEDGSLKVVDFGIAHVEASNLTDTGALLGTPAYMSPEQFLALPVDERSDLFSAGVILYELLTGDKPFTGSVTTIMQKVLHQEPLEPSVLNPMLPQAWNTVVGRAMAKQPDARYRSARQFAETIRQLVESRAPAVSVEVTLAGPAPVAPLEETLRPARDAVTPVAEPWSRAAPAAMPGPQQDSRWNRRGVAVLASVLAVGMAIAYFLGSRNDPREHSPSAGAARTPAEPAKEVVAEVPKAARPRPSQDGKSTATKQADRKAAEMKAAEIKAAESVASPLGLWRGVSQSRINGATAVGDFHIDSMQAFSYRNQYGTESSGSLQLNGTSIVGIGRMRIPVQHQGVLLPAFPDGSREATVTFRGVFLSPTKMQGSYAGGGDFGTFAFNKE
jgi:serine/threonine-protein kinase